MFSTTIISALLGIVSSLLPNLLRILEIRNAQKHQQEMLRVQLEAVLKGQMEGLKGATDFSSLANEGESLRSHDADIAYGGFWEGVRASIRPTITYFFFALFLAVKGLTITLMWNANYNATEILAFVWDEPTMALFATVIAFWFGARTMDTMLSRFTTKSAVPTAPADPRLARRKIESK